MDKNIDDYTRDNADIAAGNNINISDAIKNNSSIALDPKDTNTILENSTNPSSLQQCWQKARNNTFPPNNEWWQKISYLLKLVTELPLRAICNILVYLQDVLTKHTNINQYIRKGGVYLLGGLHLLFWLSLLFVRCITAPRQNAIDAYDRHFLLFILSVTFSVASYALAIMAAPIMLAAFGVATPIVLGAAHISSSVLSGIGATLGIGAALSTVTSGIASGFNLLATAIGSVASIIITTFISIIMLIPLGKLDELIYQKISAPRKPNEVKVNNDSYTTIYDLINYDKINTQEKIPLSSAVGYHIYEHAHFLYIKDQKWGKKTDKAKQAGTAEEVVSLWKIHISVNPNHLAQAWDITSKTLIQAKAPTFKVIKLHDLTPDHKESHARFYNGAQITIRIPKGEEKKYQELVKSIETQLHKANIHPGTIPASDRQIGSYSSVRASGSTGSKQYPYQTASQVGNYNPYGLKWPFGEWQPTNDHTSSSSLDSHRQ